MIQQFAQKYVTQASFSAQLLTVFFDKLNKNKTTEKSTIWWRLRGGRWIAIVFIALRKREFNVYSEGCSSMIKNSDFLPYSSKQLNTRYKSETQKCIHYHKFKELCNFFSLLIIFALIFFTLIMTKIPIWEQNVEFVITTLASKWFPRYTQPTKLFCRPACRTIQPTQSKEKIIPRDPISNWKKLLF